MDRFIAKKGEKNYPLGVYLKSNMDRFIGKQQTNLHVEAIYLKSNMDRFIALIFNMF